MPHDTPVDITIDLDACGYRVRPGHRLRLAISTAYWPTILPAPTDPGVTIDTASIALGLPQPEGAETIPVPEPTDEDPLPRYISHDPGADRHWIEKDRTTGRTALHIENDTGLTEHPTTGMSSRVVQNEVWAITEGDPTSATGRSDWVCEVSRPGWTTRTETFAALACTPDTWILTGEIVAFENDAEVFRKPYEHRIPRDFM